MYTKEIVIERVNERPNLEEMNVRARSEYLRMKCERERSQNEYIAFLERELRTRDKIASVDIEVHHGSVVLAAPNGWRRRIS